MFKVLGNELFSFKSFEFSGITFSQRPFNTAPDKSCSFVTGKVVSDIIHSPLHSSFFTLFFQSILELFRLSIESRINSSLLFFIQSSISFFNFIFTLSNRFLITLFSFLFFIKMFEVLGNKFLSFQSFEFRGIAFSQRTFNTAPDKSCSFVTGKIVFNIIHSPLHSSFFTLFFQSIVELFRLSIESRINSSLLFFIQSSISSLYIFFAFSNRFLITLFSFLFFIKMFEILGNEFLSFQS
jgi:hypothetical protein